MVNENFQRANARMKSGIGTDRYQLKANRKAGRLKPGDFVKPNFTDARARDDHPQGVILEIDQGDALVRWQTEMNEETIGLQYLVADKG